MASQRKALRAGLAVLSLAIASGGVGHAAAPVVPIPDGIANCVWLQVKAKGSGIEVKDAGAGIGAKRTINTVCYMQLVYVAADAENPDGHYTATILCPVDASEWEPSSWTESYSGKILADGNVFNDYDYLTFANAAGDILQGYAAHRLQISVDPKTGLFKKAIFQTIAAEMMDNSTFFESFTPVVGSYVAKGTSIPAEKVPPQALALVTGGPCP
ncbi:MAG: hypothetical protein ACHQ6T_04590 [Myxococcota bacterium]